VERLMKQIDIRGAMRDKVVKTTVPDTSAPGPRDKVTHLGTLMLAGAVT